MITPAQAFGIAFANCQELHLEMKDLENRIREKAEHGGFSIVWDDDISPMLLTHMKKLGFAVKFEGDYLISWMEY